jgi:hypothetical protein
MKSFLTLSLLAVSAAVADERQPEFYLREEIPMPEGEVLELGSIAIMPDKKVAVSSRRGDIWVCEGAYDADLSKVKWTLFARGLHEPLGMFYKDGSLFTTSRPEITKMTDTDGDGRADLFKTVTQYWGIDGNYHEYNFGSDPDKDGNVWVVQCLTGSGGASDKSPWRGWCFRYGLDGKVIPTCPGIRSPGGIGFNQAGDAFYTDNQGLWNGSSSLKWLKPGGFMGNPTGNVYAPILNLEEPPNPTTGSRMVTESDKDPRIIPPAVILPHGKVGQSPTAVIYDSAEGKFGPFKGQVLVGEQTHSQVQRVYLEKVKGLYQGAVWKFLEDFRCGVIPARMGEDATLFVGGSNRGWAARGGKNFTFERVRWTGKKPFEMHEMHVKKDGFVITFTEPVDKASASDPKSYKAAAWTYIYQKGYGSPEVDPATPVVEKATVSSDGKSVYLKVSGRVRGHVHHFNLAKVKSSKGDSLWHPDVYYTLNEIPD